MIRFLAPGAAMLIAAAVTAPPPSALARASLEGATPETSTSNAQVVRDAFDRWASGAGVFDILAPDVSWTIHGSGPVADTYHGVEDFLRRGAEPLTSRLSSPLIPEVHHIWAMDDVVIIRFDASAMTTSGRPYENRFLWIFHMRDGAVQRAEAFLDLNAYQAVIDNSPPRP